ncbi:MAG TPA: hypothetical protein VG052_09910 [Puia sp.]|jgi:hypothetical protein|nr:hypothetical protein [Puia sp.]
MKQSWKILTGVLLILSGYRLAAQEVTFCEPYSDRFTIKEELLGKVGNYYWVSMTSRKRPVKRSPAWEEDRSFIVYDIRMTAVNEISHFSCPGEELKEYLINSQDHFDQLYLSGNGSRQVDVWVQRYAPNGQTIGEGHKVGAMPFYEPGNSFLLVRSEDRNLSLLLGFEFIPGGAPKIHAILFNANWQQLSSRVYNHPFLTQPQIQDDYTGYPLEDFDQGTVKLANNGEWLMVSPSRTNNNYLLSHFNGSDTGFRYEEIWLPQFAVTEDIGLSIDNVRGEAYAGVLSDFHYTTLKNVRIVHYSMAARAFDFDTAYQLTTLGGGKVRNNNLVKESFMSMPGGGFLLLKEYGRPFEEPIDDMAFDEGWNPVMMFAANNIPDPNSGPSAGRVKAPQPHYGYARYATPINIPYHDRGDLSMYYFPSVRGDSCWSGMISEEQVTEMNSPNLSYMIVPLHDKLFCLYNSFVHNDQMYAATTVLNRKGQLVTDQGVLFWGLKSPLDFQRSRQVAPDQVVIPYQRFGRPAFAVVELNGPPR